MDCEDNLQLYRFSCLLWKPGWVWQICDKFYEFARCHAALLLAYVSLGVSKLKWPKFIKFQISLRDLPMLTCIYTLYWYEKALMNKADEIVERVVKSQSYLTTCIAWRRWDAEIISYFLWLSAWFCDMRWLRWPILLKMLTNLWETTLLCDFQAIFCNTSSLEWLKF